MSVLPVDLDSEKIQLDGQWLTRDDLAKAIKSMLDSGNYAITRHSQALERLGEVVGQSRSLSFRVSAELAEGLNQLAARQGKTAAAVLREAVARHLGLPPPAEAPAGAVPLSLGASVTAPTTITPARTTTPNPVPVVVASAPVPATAKVEPEGRRLTDPEFAHPPNLPPKGTALGQGNKPTGVQPIPTVVLDETLRAAAEALVAEPTNNGTEAKNAIELTPKPKPAAERAAEDAVERSWFGS